MKVHWKIKFLGEEGYWKPLSGGNCLRRGAWTNCRFKSGLGKKEECGVFEGAGLYPDAHYGYSGTYFSGCVRHSNFLFVTIVTML